MSLPNNLIFNLSLGLSWSIIYYQFSLFLRKTLFISYIILFKLSLIRTNTVISIRGKCSFTFSRHFPMAFRLKSWTRASDFGRKFIPLTRSGLSLRFLDLILPQHNLLARKVKHAPYFNWHCRCKKIILNFTFRDEFLSFLYSDFSFLLLQLLERRKSQPVANLIFENLFCFVV